MTQQISPQFLLFSEVCFLWALASYGISPDPLDGERRVYESTSWRWGLVGRAILAAILSFLVSHSLAVAILLMILTSVQPLVRYHLQATRTAEIECSFAVVTITALRAVIYNCHFLPQSLVDIPLRSEHKAALCVCAASLLFSVRGGTYIVRGILKKAGALPVIQRNTGTGIVAVDEIEYNRGRLIGNIERITLAIVAAAGSYAALGFLVAAKGLVRFEGTDNSRDFTEYFLIGSLTSVLIALCIGLAIRFALLALWPELLSFQMQQ